MRALTRIIALIALATATAPAPAQASPTITAASIGVTVATTPCPGYEDALGCFDETTRTIHWTDRDPRTFEHELAHVWDHDKLTDPLRSWLTHHFGRLLGRGPWLRPPVPCRFDPTQMCAPPSPGERFAEAWAFCRYPVRPGRVVESVYGYDTSGRHVRLCNAIRLLQLART